MVTGPAHEDSGSGTAPKRRKLNPRSKTAKATQVPHTKGDPSEVQVKNSQPETAEQTIVLVETPKKRRKRKSIGQQSLRRAKPQGASPQKSIPQARKGRPKAEPKPKKIQANELTVHITPEPPAYSRITTPAVPDGGQSQVPASIEADVVGDIPGFPRQKEPSINLTNGDGTLQCQIKKRPYKKRQPKEEALQKPVRRAKGVAKEQGTQSEEKAQVTASVPDTQESGAKVVNKGDVQIKTRPTGEPVGNEDSDVTATQSSKPSKPRRKKRRPIGQQSLRIKRKSVGESSPVKSGVRKRPTATVAKKAALRKRHESQTPASNPVEQALPDDNEPDTVEDKAHNMIRSPKKRGRPRKLDTNKQMNKPSTSQAPKPSKEPASSNKVTKPLTSKSRKSPKPTTKIPITIYVPTSLTSPTSSNNHNDDDSDTMDDPLSRAPPVHRKPTQAINPVDVLAQSTSETIAKVRNNLTSEANSLTNDASEKAALERKVKAVDIYGEELHEGLLHLTTTLNENINLNSEIRKATAEERALKKEIKALEAEKQRRSEIAQRQKQQESEGVQESDEEDLETTLNGIRVAVEKGWALQAKDKAKEKAGRDVSSAL